MQAFEKYLEVIKKTYFSNEAREVSYRTALENLLNEVKPDKQILVIREGKREAEFGVPDFKIKHTDSIIGYLETKIVGENLDKILKTDQIKKYISLSDNILLTNYLDWIWLKEGKEIQRNTLISLQELEANKKVNFDSSNIQAVQQLIQNFFSQAPQGISNPKKLAESLAIRAKILKGFLLEDFKTENNSEEDNRFYGLYSTFKSYVFNEFNPEDFSDTFAQMLVYGLFLAQLNADTQKVNLYTVSKFIPTSFELIKELVKFLDTLDDEKYQDIRWLVEEVLTVMNSLDLPAITAALSFNKQSKQPDEYAVKDPYIYFYEDYLAAYDPNMRKAKGVYYTPPPIVNFIVRAINEVLQTVFGIQQGLADSKQVTVLDFATGTGTFILEIIEQIFAIEPSLTKRQVLIKEHILKNIYGFEYLFAPYTIAHLKLSQRLKEEGYIFTAKERLQILLTNTLEQLDQQIKIPLLPALTEETKIAQRVKKQAILVITGNPPYSYESKNKGKWISNLIQDYCQVDGQRMKERNPKGIQDDYVKFIRFAQDKVDKAGQGIVAIITNHSFLNSPTLRGMRQSLINSFDQLYFLDLHGNVITKEQAPDGSKDEGVFDIERGVVISIFVKQKGLKKQIKHADFWGKRKVKYEMALQNDLQSIEWQELKPNSPFYLFKPQNQANKEQYETFWSVKDIFKVSSEGIVTSRDDLTIKATEKEIWEIVNKFSKISPEEARKTYKLGADSTEWQVKLAQNDLLTPNLDKSKIKKIAFRPFDIGYTYFTGKSKGFISRPRTEIMENMFQENIALNVPRQILAQDFQHVFISEFMTDKNLLQSANGQTHFPLYIYERIENLFGEANNPAYEKEAKKLAKELKPIKAYYEKYKAVYDALPNPTENETTFFEEAKTLYEEHLARYENELEQIKSNTATQSPTSATFEYSKTENFSKEFRTFINELYGKPSPEQILAYIYAILHSPIYRAKYAEFLKMDFPRIPFIQSLLDFEAMAGIGQELIDSHLQKKIPTYELGFYEGKGSDEVEKVNYIEKDQKLYINKTQYFDKVPLKIYTFQIGSYLVLDKYLKDRLGRTITLEERSNVESIIKILAFTISKMEELDQLTNWV